jgi:hypothetical protein
MGERSWARLTIGGTVSRSALAGGARELEGRRLESCLGGDHVVVEDPGVWPDMLVHLRPGGRVEVVSDDSRAEPVIPRSALRMALSRCRTLRGLRAWLARTYPEVPALPPIRWARAQKADDE